MAKGAALADDLPASVRLAAGRAICLFGAAADGHNRLIFAAIAARLGFVGPHWRYLVAIASVLPIDGPIRRHIFEDVAHTGLVAFIDRMAKQAAEHRSDEGTTDNGAGAPILVSADDAAKHCPDDGTDSVAVAGGLAIAVTVIVVSIDRVISGIGAGIVVVVIVVARDRLHIDGLRDHHDMRHVAIDDDGPAMVRILAVPVISVPGPVVVNRTVRTPVRSSADILAITRIVAAAIVVVPVAILRTVLRAGMLLTQQSLLLRLTLKLMARILLLALALDICLLQAAPIVHIATAFAFLPQGLLALVAFAGDLLLTQPFVLLRLLPVLLPSYRLLFVLAGAHVDALTVILPADLLLPGGLLPTLTFALLRLLPVLLLPSFHLPVLPGSFDPLPTFLGRSARTLAQLMALRPRVRLGSGERSRAATKAKRQQQRNRCKLWVLPHDLRHLLGERQTVLCPKPDSHSPPERHMNRSLICTAKMRQRSCC